MPHQNEIDNENMDVHSITVNLTFSDTLHLENVMDSGAHVPNKPLSFFGLVCPHRDLSPEPCCVNHVDEARYVRD